MIHDEAHCPLCDQPNRCAFAAGRKLCWCLEVDVSYDARARAEAMGASDRCLCNGCATERTVLPLAAGAH